MSDDIARRQQERAGGSREAPKSAAEEGRDIASAMSGQGGGAQANPSTPAGQAHQIAGDGANQMQKSTDPDTLSGMLRKLADHVATHSNTPEDRKQTAQELDKLAGGLGNAGLNETRAHVDQASAALKRGDAKTAADELRKAADSADREHQEAKACSSCANRWIDRAKIWKINSKRKKPGKAPRIKESKVRVSSPGRGNNKARSNSKVRGSNKASDSSKVRGSSLGRDNSKARVSSNKARLSNPGRGSKGAGNNPVNSRETKGDRGRAAGRGTGAMGKNSQGQGQGSPGQGNQSGNQSGQGGRQSNGGARRARFGAGTRPGQHAYSTGETDKRSPVTIRRKTQGTINSPCPNPPSTQRPTRKIQES